MQNQDLPIELNKPFILGKVSIDPENEKLSNSQSSINCEPKVFELLLYFCAHPQQIISRDQLLADLWQGRIVSDNAINRKIYQLRKSLQSLDKSAEYIETVPKRGYRLVKSPTQSQISDQSIENTQDKTTNRLTPTNDNSRLNQSQLNQSQLKIHKFSWLKPITAITITILLIAIGFFIWTNQSKIQNNIVTPKLVPLTSLQGTEKYPALSPNNQYLVYSHSKDGQSHQLKQLDLHNNIELDLTTATKGVHDINSQWHPKYNKLAFIRITAQGKCFIYQLSLNQSGQASNPQQIIECSNANQPSISWTEHENQLVIAERSRKTLPYQLYSINTQTGAKKQLTNDNNQSNTKGHYYIKSNARGDKLVSLLYIDSSKVQVNTYNSQDFSKIDSFELEGHLDDIAWQSTEQAFYFRHNQYIEKVDQQGLNRQVVFHVGQDFSHISFSNDGSKLVLSTKANITNILNYDIQLQKTTHSVVSSTKQDKKPAMANTTGHMAFISNRSGVNQFWLADEQLNVQPLKQLPFDLGHSYFAWSPDDQKLLFEYQDQIHLFDVKTGHNNPIITHQHQAYFANWSYQGKYIIYSSNKTDNWQLWRYDIDNKTHQQLTFDGGYAGYTDNNGQLYYSKYHHNGLFRLNPDGSETQLIEDFSLLNWLNWQLKGDNIYFAKLWGQTARQDIGIYSYHIPTGKEQLIMPIEPRQLHDYTIASDGSFIRYTRLEEQAGDVLMLDMQPVTISTNQ